MAVIEQLQRYGACHEGLEFVGMYPTFEEAWAACDRIEWLGWCIDKTFLNKEGLYSELEDGDNLEDRLYFTVEVRGFAATRAIIDRHFPVDLVMRHLCLCS
jgi:hypothetical protein